MDENPHSSHEYSTPAGDGALTGVCKKKLVRWATGIKSR
jgi:hypothetical protein